MQTEQAATPAKRREKALSAAFVRQVSEPGKYYDGHGLFLRVEANGAKRWVQRLAIRGKRREIGLGSASLVTLAKAREAALDNRRLARAGGDPLGAKRQAEAVLTFAEAARKVHEMHRPSWRNPKHAAQFITTLESYAFPHFGSVRVSDVSSADVLRALTPIWLKKPETARRVRQRIGTVMKWAVAQGWRQDNPAEAISQALPRHDATRVKHREALHYNDVGAALEKVKASGAGLSTRLAFEFLVLTATRSGEVRKATWDEMDLDKAEWLIPGERMKAKRPHRVPLSPRAVELLEQARALDDGSGLVFPGTRRGRPLSDMTLSKLLREQGIKAHVHGFRTSFKTWAQEQTNFPNEVSEAALAHVVKDKAEAAYARSDLFAKRRKLMSEWADYVAGTSDV
ncbi:MAG: tyrosine-type recombinase/integrase [Pseudomonadota bacterium]